jgi:poly(A) polymerase
MENIVLKSTHHCILGPVAELLSANHVEAYLVGGAVRDALLGRETKDIDIAVRTDAHKFARTLADNLKASFVSLDVGRDIARIVGGTGDERYEIDVAHLQGDLNSDLARRDFTIDAMAVSLDGSLDGELAVVDPHDGRGDLETGTIRAVQSDVIRQDPVRSMRAVRLAASLKFEIESGTKELIFRDATLINSTSPERIRDELLKTLAEKGARDSVRLMDELGLLSALIPEIDESRGVTQPKEHYYDVFNHLVETVGFVEQILDGEDDGSYIQEMLPRFEGMAEYFDAEATDMHSRLTLLKLTGLLHDIAKPATKTIEESGRVRFFDHPTVGEEMAGTILRRLRFGRKGVRLVKTMIRQHLRPRQMNAKGQMPTKRAVHRYYRDVGDAALDTLYLNMADFLAARGPDLTRDQMAEGCKVIDHILKVGQSLEQRVEPVGHLLDGKDIIREFGLSQGPLIGRVLSTVAEAEAVGKVNTTEEAIRLATEYLESEGGGG